MKRGYLVLIIGGVVIFIILLILFLLGGRKPITVQPVTLEWWGVFDEAANYQDAINAYKSQHPYITIVYKKFREEEYEDALIQAWAGGKGPDFFALPNTWMYKFYDRGYLAPMPASTRMAFYSISKPLGVKEELKVEYKDIPSITLTEITNQFIDIVATDSVIDGEVYGLPQSIDTLVLFYNKELLNYAVITQPPLTWNDFLDAVPTLTILDANGSIVQSGAALGTYENVPRAFDIISAIMMQNGTTMTNEKNKIVFNAQLPGSTDKPADQALQFYTDFAQSTKQAYTWDSLQPDALEAFIAGETAFFIGYQYHRDILANRATNLKWSLSFLPQVDPVRPINYGNYWIQAVAKRSEHSNEAWDFIQSLSGSKGAALYINKTNRTPVRIDLLSELLTYQDPLINTFAQQAITAKSWYRGKSPDDADEEFSNMVSSVLNGTQTVSQAINTAAQRISTVY